MGVAYHLISVGLSPTGGGYAYKGEEYYFTKGLMCLFGGSISSYFSWYITYWWWISIHGSGILSYKGVDMLIRVWHIILNTLNTPCLADKHIDKMLARALACFLALVFATFQVKNFAFCSSDSFNLY